MEGPAVLSLPPHGAQKPAQTSPQPQPHGKPNQSFTRKTDIVRLNSFQELQVGTVSLYGIHIVSLVIEGQERLCLAQISNTLLKQFSYNEIHNRRVALGITCVQCTPVQLEILRRAGAMPPSSRRCGMITRREAERLCKSFLSDNAPPRLPDDFAFSVHHECAWGCRGAFLPSRYNSSRAKCIKCTYCGLFFSPNKFIFHSHRTGPGDKYVQPDAANFNSWRRHMKLSGTPPDDVVHAWEDVKAMFNGGTRKRLLSSPGTSRPSSAPKQQRLSPIITTTTTTTTSSSSSSAASIPPIINNTLPPSSTAHQVHPRVPPFPELPLPISRSLVMDYVWHQHQQAAAAVAAAKTPGFPFSSYALPWLTKRSPVLFPGHLSSQICSSGGNEAILPPVVSSPIHQSAFRPVIRSSSSTIIEQTNNDEQPEISVDNDEDSDDEVDIETTEDDDIIKNNSLIVSQINVNQSIQNNRDSPECWSPPRESEREAEKIAEESTNHRDIKPDIKSTKCPSETWHGNAFYRHLNILKEGFDGSKITLLRDCSMR